MWRLNVFLLCAISAWCKKDVFTEKCYPNQTAPEICLNNSVTNGNFLISTIGNLRFKQILFKKHQLVVDVRRQTGILICLGFINPGREIMADKS